MIEIGSKILFTKRIVEEATGDHPSFLLAKEGEHGEVLSNRNETHFAVKNITTNEIFMVYRDEFVVI